MLVQFRCPDAKRIEVLEGLKAAGIGKVQIFEEKSVPALPSDQSEFEEKAQSIAKKIAPKNGSLTRKEAIRLVLGGGDTFTHQGGETDPALRNATGALSKALRPWAQYAESPLEILAQRARETFDDEAGGKGVYKGTRYFPTRLGRRVFEILVEAGKI